MEKGEEQLEKPAFPPQFSFQCIQKAALSVLWPEAAPPALPCAEVPSAGTEDTLAWCPRVS